PCKNCLRDIPICCVLLSICEKWQNAKMVRQTAYTASVVPIAFTLSCTTVLTSRMTVVCRRNRFLIVRCNLCENFCNCANLSQNAQICTVLRTSGDIDYVNICLLYYGRNRVIELFIDFSSMEAHRSLVGRPVFKTGGGDEKSPWWV